MEDTLRERLVQFVMKAFSISHVLILVVMEDTLRAQSKKL